MPDTPCPAPLKLLILGGSGFVGRHTVRAALARGHAVTVLDRGRRDATLFDDQPAVRRLRGDRDGDLSSLRGLAFDAVIDTGGYRAEHMQRLAQTLADTAAGAHWVFISSISAYASFPPGRETDETCPLATGDEGYAAGKARAEEALAACWPAPQQAIVRPGLVVGPEDPTGRFTYWPLRCARGGEVLAPGEPNRLVQCIDVRDLAEWSVDLCERRQTGCFNAVTRPFPMGRLLQACIDTTAAEALGGPAGPVRLTWRDDESLLAAGVQPWTDLPLWLPAADPEVGGMLQARPDRALAAGLRCRDLAETVADTYRWARQQQIAPPKQVPTLTEELETAVLAGARGAGAGRE